VAGPENLRPAVLDSLLEELEHPGTAEVIPRRIAICRRVLRLLPPEPPTIRRAEVLDLLGDLLATVAGRSGRRLDEVLGVYEQAAAALESVGLAHDRARALVKIARLCLTRSDGFVAGRVQRAASACKTALALLTPEVDFEAWAAASVNLAIAYKLRTGEDRAAGQEKALALLLRLQKILSGDLLGTVLNNLASLYLERLQGDREDNLEQAIRSRGHRPFVIWLSPGPNGSVATVRRISKPPCLFSTPPSR